MLLCQQEWRKTSWWHLNKHLQESKVELCVGLTFPIGGGFLDEPNEVFLGVVELVVVVDSRLATFPSLRRRRWPSGGI